MSKSRLPKLGRRLRAARQSREESLRDVASAVGCTHITIRNVERGNNDPGISLVAALAKHFGLSLDVLVRP